jgi:hypothetical protein
LSDEPAMNLRDVSVFYSSRKSDGACKLGFSLEPFRPSFISRLRRCRMAFDDRGTTRSRVVIQTPTARRKFTNTEYDEDGGPSTVVFAVIVILAVAVAGLLGVMLYQQMNSNRMTAEDQPTQQLTTQQPVIVQQPAPAAQQPAIIVNPPASTAPGREAAKTVDDSIIQSTIEQKLRADATLSALDVTSSVVNGKVLLVGKVKTDQLKQQVEKSVLAIKGVTAVDNQIIVTR